MPITNDHLVGFVAGVGVSTVAFYWYDQNRHRVDAYLRAQGMPAGQTAAPWQSTHAAPRSAPYPSNGHPPTLEELMAQKERLEDMIAELLAAQQQAAKTEVPV
jgi:hypothetical protein